MFKRKVLLGLIAVSLTGLAIAKPDIEAARIDSLVKEIIAQSPNTPDQPKPNAAEIRKQVEQRLMMAEVLKAEAIKAGLDKQPEIQYQLQNLEAQFYAGAFVNSLAEKVQVNEQDLRDAYEKMNRVIQLQQVHFDTADKAREAQQLLLKGMSFGDLMKRFPNPEQQFTDYINPQQLPPEIATAISNMNRGDVTKEPILLNGQYYLFKLSGVGKAPNAQPFEQVKDQLANMAKQQKVDEEIRKILKANGIEN